jgi:septal ring factor EnvC (AmiA/AmiB activator)
LTTARAPGASRTLTRDDDVAAQEPAAAEAWPVRARLWLRMRTDAVSARGKRRLLAAATAALDRGIASLQALRKCTGAAQVQDAPRERGRPEQRVLAQPLGDDPAVAAQIAPTPRRRLRALLIYLGVALAGGMLGVALAYNLLAQLLERRATAIERQEAKLSGYSKSVLELKKALAQQQTERTATEARLTASLADSETKLGQLQAQRAGTELPPAHAPGALARDARPQEAARGGQAGWTRSGSCTLSGGDVRAVLAGCIADMNRK